MPNTIVIDAATRETRVAILEGGILRDFFMERRGARGIVGNVYKGKVIRVLPGMQAAFVDIGLEKAAFLYVTDVYKDHAALEMPEQESEDEEEDDLEGAAGTDKPRAPRRGSRNMPPIEDQLTQGQEILVQVVKEPIGTKGARVTCHVSLPGRHLVFMPTVDHLGISRQIASDKERKRLRSLAAEMRPAGGGFIVRTAAEGVPSELLRRDMAILIDLWNNILEASKRAKGRHLLHEDLDVVLRATRDLATENIDEMIIDTRDEYDRVMAFVQRVMPRFARRIKLYVGEEPIFDAYGIEQELRRAVDRRADLPSGGYLIIEKTEALTSIDVNTGRFVGSSNLLEETIVQTNIEAAAEIAYQLKLRSIGGLIIIDFIDMEHAKNRQRVERAFQDAVAKDRGRVKFSRISEFGIMEMTRKRTGDRLSDALGRECPACGGSGRTSSPETVAYDTLRAIRREAPRIAEQQIRVVLSHEVAQYLRTSENSAIRDLEMRLNKKLILRGDRGRRIETCEISGVPAHEANANA